MSTGSSTVLARLTAFVVRLPFCGKVGAIAGATVGLLAATSYVAQMLTTWAAVWQVGLLLAVPAWLTVLFVVGVLLRYRCADLAVPALVNCLLTSLATIAVLHLLPPSGFAILVGALVGAAVGSILCWLCERLSRWP
jgi:hypothetical protein